ncbi:MAG: GDP-mannose 4,6-dehydratase [Bryobacterales bacterium]|nr:GDP-mannose 4,6-dehydratase [Bryobacterales bacterium]
MAHYLVTGCAGFIASRVSELLVEAGHTVTGIDNLNDAYDRRMKHWRLERLRTLPGFTFAEADISDNRELTPVWRAMPQPETVFNLAARAGVRQSVENPSVYFDTNVTGTLNLLELARQSGVPRFLLASTSSLYGAHNPMPYREDADTGRPLSPYAASKKAAEALCYSYHHLYGLHVAIPRYFTVYGPAGRPDMSAFRFVQWISEGRPVTVFGDGTQRRDFTFVDDIARGTIAAGLTTQGFEAINLGSDQPVELMSAIRLIEKLVGRPAQLTYQPAHPADVNATWADIGKAQTKLQWRPLTQFTEGVEHLVRWYRDNASWARLIETGA